MYSINDYREDKQKLPAVTKEEKLEASLLGKSLNPRFQSIMNRLVHEPINSIDELNKIQKEWEILWMREISPVISEYNRRQVRNPYSLVSPFTKALTNRASYLPKHGLVYGFEGVVDQFVLLIRYCITFSIPYKEYLTYVGYFDITDIVISIAYYYSFHKPEGKKFNLYEGIKRNFYGPLLKHEKYNKYTTPYHIRDLELLRLNKVSEDKLDQLPKYNDILLQIISRIMIFNGDLLYFELGLTEEELKPIFEEYYTNNFHTFQHKYMYHLVENETEIKELIRLVERVNNKQKELVI